MDTKKVSVPVAKRNSQLSNVMAAQCLSPTVTRPLAPEILQRSREIEHQQRRLIAGLGKQTSDTTSSAPPHASMSAAPVVWRSGQISTTPGPLTQPTSPSKSRSKSPDNLNTKRMKHFGEPISPKQSVKSGLPEKSMAVSGNNETASSSSQVLGSPSSEDSPQRKKVDEARAGLQPPTFRGRRAVRPAHLDLDALRRERQFSGPYSANPLLEQKQALSLPRTSNPELNSEKRADGEKAEEDKRPTRLPNISQMTSGPFTSGIQSPLQAFSQSAKTIQSVPLSAAPPLTSQFHSNPGTTANSVNAGHGMSSRMNHANNSGPSSGSVATMNAQEKKAKFLQLCSDAWDLLQS